MNENSHISDELTRTLSKKELDKYLSLKPHGLWSKLKSLFAGPQVFIHVAMTLIMVPIFGVGLYAGYEFLTSHEVAELVYWGVVMFIAFIMISVLKIMLLIQMIRHETNQDVDRIEYLVTLLFKKKRSLK